MGKKVKNKDLAARLGLSGTLVSLVLNNKAEQHGIRKDTQERVLALARQMGYFDQQKEKGEPAVLVRRETSPEDVRGMDARIFREEPMGLGGES